MRAYKTVNDAYIEPISFTVPRRAETFQSDIYPPASGIKPGVTAGEWLSGKTDLPPKIDFESIYEGSAPVEVPADYKPPAPTPAPAPVSKPAPQKEPEPAPAPAVRSPPPTLKEQNRSMAAIASKYDDNDESDDDETSSFEEISKPPQRSSIPARSEPKSPTKTTSAAAPKAAAQIRSPTYAPTPTAATPTSTPLNSAGVESSLVEIKKILEMQTTMISVQGQQISHLTDEVDSLKKRVGSGTQDQSERIRQLELELEELRS